jgi:hypothetical protein
MARHSSSTVMKSSFGSFDIDMTACTSGVVPVTSGTAMTIVRRTEVKINLNALHTVSSRPDHSIARGVSEFSPAAPNAIVGLRHLADLQSFGKPLALQRLDDPHGLGYICDILLFLSLKDPHCDLSV